MRSTSQHVPAEYELMTEKHDSIADSQVTDFQSEFRLSDEAQDGVLF